MKNILLLIMVCVGFAVPVQAATAYQNGVDPYPAPALTGLTNWMSSEALTLDQLRGKVVLIDFWTYSCINCIRTLPMLKAWDAKYRDKGLVILGISAPEFAFEKDPANVQRAVRRFGIGYPVALDNDMKTWHAYKNNYWPAKYLIDKSGQVVYTHFGEGNDAVTERNIRQALDLKDGALETEMPNAAAREQSPETYLGYARTQNFRSPEAVQTNGLRAGGLQAGQVANYSYPFQLGQNQWALTGQWEAREERTISQAAESGLRYRFSAGKVFLVMGIGGKPVQVTVKIDGKPIAPEQSGKDVTNSTVTVDSERLYELVDLRGAFETHTLELTASDAGLSIYAFTFGK